ncbi:response regulator transcription factor [Pseudonocardia sp. DSM 110487]|uniref:response regulator transcription factor n=1 Tax=Pseudonocardia sp. DSM 110487 TaxID=2865833 RepID=UPI001C69A659|nr:response regulator transcription factor [Pseudonocardia sp. DSM 110487]QYN38178.1 response regulator transcription factor [Pseudonocardia sp. DSM 110487]
MLIVDQQPLFRRGLEEALPAASDGGVRVVAGTDRADSAAMLVRRHQPDVVIVDLELDTPGPLAALAAIRRAQPRLPVLALTRHVQGVLEFLGAGASGVLLRTRSPAGLVPSLLAATGAATRPAPQRTGPQLTGKERHVWTLIAGGASTAQIARALHVSERTVKRLTAGLLRTLGVANRTEAAALAGRAGLLDERRSGSPP